MYGRHGPSVVNLLISPIYNINNFQNKRYTLGNKSFEWETFNDSRLRQMWFVALSCGASRLLMCVRRWGFKGLDGTFCRTDRGLCSSPQLRGYNLCDPSLQTPALASWSPYSRWLIGVTGWQGITCLQTRGYSFPLTLILRHFWVLFGPRHIFYVCTHLWLSKFVYLLYLSTLGSPARCPLPT